jgi:hypothetical protein
MYSACLNVSIRPIPGGRYLLVTGDESFLAADAYILDSLSGQREPFLLLKNGQSYDVLARDLLLLYPRYQNASPSPYHLLNQHSNQLTPFEKVTDDLIPEPFLADGSLNPELMALLEHADAVYLLRQAEQALVLETGWEEGSGDILLLDEDQFPKSLLEN